MITGSQIVETLTALGITHVVYLPDATLGQWEQALSTTPGLRLVRICREGEAWPLACGLQLGGARPLIVMQCTGLFESCDSLRNILFELESPLYAIVGHRNALTPGSTDTARAFTEPVLHAWGLDAVSVAEAEDLSGFAEHYRRTQAAGKPGIALLAEGRG